MATFTFEYTKTIEIYVDDSLSYLVGNDEFEKSFWHLESLEELAQHIAWNRGVMGWDYVEGLKPEEQDKFKILSVEWE